MSPDDNILSVGYNAIYQTAEKTLISIPTIILDEFDPHVNKATQSRDMHRNIMIQHQLPAEQSLLSATTESKGSSR